MKQDAAAIVVAGGRGKRFGGKVRKQYLFLSGRPLLWWAVNAFDRSRSIGAIVLVVPQKDLSWAHQQFSRWKMRKPLHIVAGGETRADSVRQGLAAVPREFRWIAVHDGVRPLVNPLLIEKVLKDAHVHRAAIAACPSHDTVKMARGQTIQRTLPRQDVWLAQTPQAFERKLLEQAHDLESGRSLRGTVPPSGVTDDSQLVERLGVRVRLVESSAENFKVTVPMDLKIAEIILKNSGAG